MSPDDYISVRDWRRKPPLRLRVTSKPDVCWFWIKCTRCPHMAAVAIVPYIIRWDRTAGRTCCAKWPAARSAASAGEGERAADGQRLVAVAREPFFHVEIEAVQPVVLRH